MASLGNGKLEVKTLGDLRKLLSLFDGEPDETELNFEDPSGMYTIILTDEIDISYSEPSATVECKIKWNVGDIT